jgi:type IV secretion system protein VirB6
MANWHLFTATYALVTTSLQDAVNNNIARAVAYVRPVLLAGVTLWIAFQSVAVANGSATVNSLYRGIFRAAIVVAILQTAGTFDQYVSGLAQLLPTEITAAISGTPPANIANGAAFDTLANQAVRAGLLVWQHIPAYSLSGAVMSVFVGFYFIFVVGVIAASFAVWLMSSVTLWVLLSIGPLFVALYAFPQTQRFGAGWLGVVLGTIVTQILCVVLLGLLAGAASLTTTPLIASMSNGAAPNFIDELLQLLGEGVLFGLIAMLIKQVPGLASSITGGAVHNVQQLTSLAFAPGSALASRVGQAMNAGARAAGRGAASAAGSGASKIAGSMRSGASTGKSLSGDGPGK